jgi:hypothetical protein
MERFRFMHPWELAAAQGFSPGDLKNIFTEANAEDTTFVQDCVGNSFAVPVVTSGLMATFHCLTAT